MNKLFQHLDLQEVQQQVYPKLYLPLKDGITSPIGADMTARGLAWSPSQNSTVSLTTITTDERGDGSFTSNFTGLKPNTQYYVSSYSTNNAARAYGNEISFATTDVNYAYIYPAGTVFWNNLATARFNEPCNRKNLGR